MTAPDFDDHVPSRSSTDDECDCARAVDRSVNAERKASFIVRGGGWVSRVCLSANT